MLLKKGDLNYKSKRGKILILVNIHYILISKWDINSRYLSLEKADNNRSSFANELKNFERGAKTLFLIFFFFNYYLVQEKKVLINFTSRIFPIKNWIKFQHTSQH